MEYQNYLDEFDKFSKQVYNNNMPTSSEGSQGSILAVKSFYEDLAAKLPIINDTLKSEANRILKEVSNETSIDADKMKEDLFAIIHKNHNEWMETIKS